MTIERVKELAAAMGLRVFMRPAANGAQATWAYLTDGTRIAYVEWGRFHERVGSAHVPNRQTGIGFVVAESITESAVLEAMRGAPDWASATDRAVSRPWRDWDAFCASSAFNSEYKEI